jgi:hypothetical protein
MRLHGAQAALAKDHVQINEARHCLCKKVSLRSNGIEYIVAWGISQQGDVADLL